MIVTNPRTDGFETDSPQARLLTDFTSSSSDLDWHVVNDNVMGGRSRGGFEPEGGGLQFAGATNTHGGGFSSIRTGPLELDLAIYAGIQVRVMGDGRRYAWRLTSDARWQNQPVAYWAEFDTVKDTWLEVRIPFSAFVPRFRGTELKGPALDPARISGMGLVIYDGKDGPFELRLASVHAYSTPSREVAGRVRHFNTALPCVSSRLVEHS